MLRSPDPLGYATGDVYPGLPSAVTNDPSERRTPSVWRTTVRAVASASDPPPIDPSFPNASISGAETGAPTPWAQNE